jgi:histidinol-phosphate aminotransferase
MDAVPVKIPLSHFHVDLEGILERVTPRTRIIFINNPNNPTGTVVPKHGFDDFLAALPEEVVVILDEAYREFVEEDDTPHGEDYLSGPPWVITMRTFSKAYGLAGLRIGYGIAAPPIAELLDKVRQPFNVNSLGQVGACAALDDQDHFHKTIVTVRHGRRFLYEELEKQGIPYIPSQANYIMIHVGIDCEQVYRELLHQGVIVRPLTSFGYHDYIRVSIGKPQENARFLEALTTILHSL